MMRQLNINECLMVSGGDYDVEPGVDETGSWFSGGLDLTSFTLASGSTNLSEVVVTAPSQNPLTYIYEGVGLFIVGSVAVALAPEIAVGLAAAGLVAAGNVAIAGGATLAGVGVALAASPPPNPGHHPQP